MNSPRRSRNRAACRRCQRRKIRCDGHTPSCGSCQKSGVPCVNDGKLEVDRSHIANLENRMKWLESIVRERCTDIDIDGARRGGYPDMNFNNASSEENLNDSLSRLPAVEGPSTAIVNGVQQSGNTTTDREESHGRPQAEAPQQAHEIGFVSLSPGGDPRYIGPSSGYFVAKRIISTTGSGRRTGTGKTMGTSLRPRILSAELLNTPAPLPMDRESALELCDNYFETVHLVYPFLHRQTHMAIVDRAYASTGIDPIESFQVYMVLAIAALNVSRQCKLRLPAEGYLASAMQYVDYVCNHGTMAALQGLLLLMVYALYNPSCNVNIWNLNYQCLASVIDLGLQRDVRASPSTTITVFDQEMRTRVFWVVYTFDRTVCTMMGRPIGLRDEACDIRFPLDISDDNLMKFRENPPTPTGFSTHMSHSIHLFKLAQLNSEIKYVMHSVNRDVPAYALPPVRDILSWQSDMINSLQSWISTIPEPESDQDHIMKQFCQLRYHETMVLLLRPSPGVPSPTDKILTLCFEHALHLIKGYGALYASGNLLYSRFVVHSILLGTLFIMHCIWKIPGIAKEVPIRELILVFNISQNVLSSIGEHWDEASRARDSLEELCGITIERLLKTSGSSTGTSFHRTRCAGTGTDSQGTSSHGDAAVFPPSDDTSGGGCTLHLQEIPPSDELTGLFNDLFTGNFPDWNGLCDFDGLMGDLFNIPA